MNTCKTCGEMKPTEQFSKRRRSCKPCRNAAQKALYADPDYRARARRNAKLYYENNKGKAKAYRKKWRAENKYKIRLKNAAYRYGVPVEEIKRILSEWENVCAICGGTNGAFEICIDHCHESGRIRGLLCTRCNLGLGYFDHDSQKIAQAARYLE